MQEDVQREFDHAYDKMNDADARQKAFTDACHNTTASEMLDVQEAYSDIMLTDINNELLGGN